MLGKDMVDYLTDTMSVRPAMIAALLDVSKGTLKKWEEIEVERVPPTHKMRKLIKLYGFIQAVGSAVVGKWLICLLDEPLYDDGSSVLCVIVDGPLYENLNLEFCDNAVNKWLEDSL